MLNKHGPCFISCSFPLGMKRQGVRGMRSLIRASCKICIHKKRPAITGRFWCDGKSSHDKNHMILMLRKAPYDMPSQVMILGA